MGINEVKEEILNNARQSAEEIIKEAEKEKALLENSANNQIQEIKKKLDSEAESAISQYRTMALAKAKGILRKEKLSLESEMINKVFQKAKEKLKDLPESKRKAHISALAKKSEGLEKAYCSKKDINIAKKLVKEAIEKDMLGGLIFEDSKGEIRIDLSYEAMLEDIKKEKIKEIAEMLFA